MQKNKAIIYIDPSGKEHDALVTAINQMHDGVISLIYAVDDPENRGALNSTTIEVFDIPHMSAQSEVHTVPASGELGMRGVVVEQGNSDLPTYHIHCWKEAGEEHKALPADHPAFDGKYAWPQADEHGKFARVSRPAFEADQAAIAQPDGDPGDSIDDEPTVSALSVGTKHYSDGSSATGVLPLPDRSPAQQDADVLLNSTKQAKPLRNPKGKQIRQ
jgi:hypothetical protein